jgi:hypothetical protein
MYEYIGILLGAGPILHISRLKVKGRHPMSKGTSGNAVVNVRRRE